MAVTYTAAGAVAAMAGAQVQAFFQQPWIIGTFAALFVLLAMAMFGFFNLQVPAACRRGSRTSATARRHLRRHRGDGRAVGADRLGLRRAAAGRQRWR
jgi:thioredoxin:protein disulfide reductase